MPATTAAPPPPIGGNSYEVIKIRIRASPHAHGAGFCRADNARIAEDLLQDRHSLWSF
jgi:hypothetical protein